MLLVVAAVLVSDNGRVLVQQRPENGSLAGLWEFPGGKLESGETPEAAVVRELHEELGILLDPVELSPACFASAALDDGHLLLLLYICRKWRGTPTALHASSLQWLHPNELHTLPMPAPDKPLIAMLQRLI